MWTNHKICNRCSTTQNNSEDQIIFSCIFLILLTKFRHAAHEILILLTFLHPLISIKDRIFFPSVQSFDTLLEGRPEHRHSPIQENFCNSFSRLLILQVQGKMKLYTFSLVIVMLVASNSIKFNLELQKYILKFGYGINYKYEGMLAHSFDRFYIITKFMLPSMGDIKFSNLNFDHSCTYMNKKYAPNRDSSKY